MKKDEKLILWTERLQAFQASVSNPHPIEPPVRTS